MYEIQKCDDFFPDKNEIFKNSKSIIKRIESLKLNLKNIVNQPPSKRIKLAEDIKDFIDNFTSNSSKLREFLSLYPTHVKGCIISYTKDNEYINSKINFNLRELDNCSTIIPLHRFYFELIIKEIFDNISREFGDTSVELNYCFDENYFAIIQNKPFNEKRKKNGGLFYIKSVIELYGGLFEEFKEKDTYQMKFNFNNL